MRTVFLFLHRNDCPILRSACIQCMGGMDMNEPMKLLWSLIPIEHILQDQGTDGIEEIRLYKGQSIQLCFRHKIEILPLIADEELLQTVLDRSTQRSPYAVREMLRRGFLILPGGHRMGICGTGVYGQRELFSLRDISSVNIRIAKAVLGFGTPVADTLWCHPGSALCIGPPGRGKTTLLRDAIRQLSSRFGERIALIDERLEVAACLDGRPQFDLGPTTDVLSAVKKVEGIHMLTRSMNPSRIALDEITAEEDVEAMIRSSYCGVRFLATAHGDDLSDLYRRPIYRRLMESGIFDYVFVIGSDRRVRKEVLCCCG